jgi:hypothetical protein
MVVKYTYQIKSVLKSRDHGILGFRVVVATRDEFFDVDVPAEIFEYEVLAYVRFRIKVYPFMDVRSLPRPLQSKIRTPLGRFLDLWILDNKYGNSGERKSPNA